MMGGEIEFDDVDVGDGDLDEMDDDEEELNKFFRLDGGLSKQPFVFACCPLSPQNDEVSSLDLIS